ncbi:MAG: hypothetical protein R3Y24_02675 [Eubacteriales bacterium]
MASGNRQIRKYTPRRINFTIKVRKTKNTQIAIYYNQDKGYIIFPFGILENGPRVIMPYFIKGKMNDAEFENSIIKCIEYSETSLPIKKTEFNKNIVLETANLKSQSQLDKLFRFIICEKKDNLLYLINRETKTTISFEESDVKTLCKNIHKIFNGDQLTNNDNILSFKTSHGNIVSYTALPDGFINMGDGHTDAYQIYEHEDSDKTYIGFFIDSGYDSFTEMSIKNKWQGWYRDLLDFKFEVINKERIKISAKTNDKIIKSYLIREKDRFIEVKYEVEISDKKSEVERAFKKLISSIKITLKL